MSQRHPVQNGNTMFITTNVEDRKPIFADAAAARIAIETLYSKQEFYPFYLYGFVIMPDHCHFLLEVPEGGSISKIMNVYKRGVSFAIGRGPIWQPRFYVRTPDDIAATLRYIHLNPVVAGLCEMPEEYPWSSASERWNIDPVDLYCCF